MTNHYKTLSSPDSIEHLKSLVLKTLSGNENAEFYFKKSKIPSLNGDLLAFPKNEDGADYDFPYIRGVVDSVSLQLKYHDKDVLDKIAKGYGRNIQEALVNAEKARCELLGIMKYSGIKSNICNMLEYEFQRDDYTQFSEDRSFAKALYLQILMLNIDLSPQVNNFILENNKNISIAKISNLTNAINDQEIFLNSVLNIINDLESKNEDQTKGENEKTDPQKKDVNSKSDSKNQDKTENSEPEKEQQQNSESNAKKDNSVSFSSGQDIDLKKTKAHENFIDISSYDISDFPTIKQKYRPFTTKYDEIIEANKLCSREELVFLNKKFQDQLDKLAKVSNKDVNKFIRTLVAVTNKWWSHNLEDGKIDPKKFPAIIANPNFQEYFKKNQVRKDSNTIVSLLLDNSGSMRGKPISVTAMSCDIIAKILEKFSIKTEILGFTTSEWRGGKSRKDWELKESPQKPGRLNDIRHIIYKSADIPFVKARKNIALMMKEGLLKENIDGEAILWAASRLNNSNYARKILIVVSDGAPVDDSTTAANEYGYLDSHLKESIKHIEEETDIEISAIGIGHEVNRYYKNSIKIKDVEDLNKTMFNELARMLKFK